MVTRWLGLSALLVVALLVACRPCFSQTPDDPFYDWDLERYRLLRTPEDPTGGMLPLPDPPVARERSAPNLIGFWVEAAGVDSAVAAPDGDGRRLQDGLGGRAGIDHTITLPYSIDANLAARFLDAENQGADNQWMERSLSRSTRSVEIRVGLTRSYWGDGASGSLLLGRTAPPLEMVRIRSVRPWRLPYAGRFGRIHGSFFLAYLDDADRHIAYPLLHGARLEWEPTDWFRFAASRTILFGGVGRTKKLTLSDLWDIWLGRNENLVGERPISDSDQKASFTFELRLPQRYRPFAWFEGARFFYEYAGEDSFEGLFPTAVAHQMGGTIAAFGWLGMIEFCETNDDSNWWYVRHNVYGEGAYFYRGYVLGHPMEADGLSGLIKVWSPSWRSNRGQILIRKRGHWDRRERFTPWWEHTLGVRMVHEISTRASLEAGLEMTRSRGTLDPLPDPPVRYLFTLALTSRLPWRWMEDARGPGVR